MKQLIAPPTVHRPFRDFSAVPPPWPQRLADSELWEAGANVCYLRGYEPSGITGAGVLLLRDGEVLFVRERTRYAVAVWLKAKSIVRLLEQRTQDSESVGLFRYVPSSENISPFSPDPDLTLFHVYEQEGLNTLVRIVKKLGTRVQPPRRSYNLQHILALDALGGRLLCVPPPANARELLLFRIGCLKHLASRCNFPFSIELKLEAARLVQSMVGLQEEAEQLEGDIVQTLRDQKRQLNFVLDNNHPSITLSSRVVLNYCERLIQTLDLQAKARRQFKRNGQWVHSKELQTARYRLLIAQGDRIQTLMQKLGTEGDADAFANELFSRSSAQAKLLRDFAGDYAALKEAGKQELAAIYSLPADGSTPDFLRELAVKYEALAQVVSLRHAGYQKVAAKLVSELNCLPGGR